MLDTFKENILHLSDNNDQGRDRNKWKSGTSK